MIKKILIIIISVISINICFAKINTNKRNEDINKIYTKDKNNVIEDSDLSDPIRNGTENASENIWWLAGKWQDFTNSENRQKSFINYIANPINYLLSFLWILVTILIIKDGFAIITAAWNENKKKEALINVKNYLIALILIWASYLIINFIFYLVNTSAKDISYNHNLIYKL